MGITKRAFVEKDAAYEVDRQRYRESVREYLADFTERLPLRKYCKIEGRKQFDRTWEIAVTQAIRELGVESANINNSAFFRTPSDKNAVKALAEKKHSTLFEKFGPKSSKRCPRCSRKMYRRLARRGRMAGTYFWGCSGFPKCSHSEEYIV